MPGCVLRVESKTTRVEPLLKTSGLHPIVVFRKGQPRAAGSTQTNRRSGFNVDVSLAGGDLEPQVRDVIKFLKRHSAGISRLRRHAGFAGMTLDFAVYDRTTDQRPWPSYRLPASLIELAGKHGLEIDLSIYGSGSTPSV